MQKFILLAFCCLAASTVSSAQNRASVAAPPSLTKQTAPFEKKAALAEPSVPGPQAANPLQVNEISNAGLEEVVALTRWDAQSYGCMPSRIYALDNGKPAASWIFGNDPDGSFPERGTGYSVRTGDLTWSNAAARIESVRTGFPAVARLGDGTEVLVAHTTAFTPYRILFARKAPGENTWTESYLQLPNGSGCLWPHIATSGQNIHVIAITTPTGNGGVVYEGMNGHILYWRSTDGGLTWDKNAAIIPGLDNSKYSTFSADNYTLDANGDIVSVVGFSDWNDTQLFKSYDNGDSWESATIIDFPDALENYAALAGESYTFEQTGGVVDPNAPDSLAVFTSDGFGSVLVDDAGITHVWYGRMYLVDNDPAAGSFYYPATNGLDYWNESFGAPGGFTITGALDLDGDTALTISNINEIGPYYNSLSSFAVTGTDANGTIYLVYSALNELFRSDWGAEKDQFYRHIYMMASGDGGSSWTDPLEITSLDYVDEFTLDYIEAVYPAIPRHITDPSNLWILYQQDATPGTDLWGDNHSSSDNGIMWVGMVPLDSKNLPKNDPSLALEISPNPASDLARISAEFNGIGASAKVDIIDMFGRTVAGYAMPNASGRQSLTIPVHELPAGAYLVRVREGARLATGMLVKG